MESRPPRLRRVIWPVVVAVVALCLAAGAAVAKASPGPSSRHDDPLEGLNRGLYAVHRGIDKVILRPVTGILMAITPKPLRKGVHNVLLNLGEPVTVLNDLLQLRIGKAATATSRFVANSTFGVLGLFDVATAAGVPYHTADFGQTLGRYGIPPGPYLFVPVLGPSSVRDLGGRVVDATIDPVKQVQFEGDGDLNTSRIALGAIDTRVTFDKDLQELDRSATDPYVTLRSVYLQNRQTFIRGGRVDVQSLPSFGPETPGTSSPAPRSEAEPVDGQMVIAAETFFRSVR